MLRSVAAKIALLNFLPESSASHRNMPATRRSGASIKEESYGEIPMMKAESYGENLRAMDVSDPAVADLGTLASGSSDDLVIDPAAVSAALADQLDDSVMRDALFTLGFDEIPPMSFTMDAAADDADIDTNDGKKARTTGANQRAVQKRYRERKKQHTASLEAKVAELQSRIDDLESEKKGAAAHTNDTNGESGDAMQSAACGLRLAGADAREPQSAVCEYARREYLLKFGERVRAMKGILERGASDGELRHSLRQLMAYCMGKNPDYSPGSLIKSNAQMLNREACSSKRGKLSDSDGSSGGEGLMSHPEYKNAVIRSNEGHVRCEGFEGAGRSVCQSVCGGPLRVTIDGSTPSEDEANAHWITVAKTVLDEVPPSETNKLIRFRDEYVRGISNIYEERQSIGAKLAGVGQPFASAAVNGKGGDSPPSGSDGSDDIIVAETTQGEAFVDTMAVVEALRQSVTRELQFKMNSMPTLVLETLSPRTSAKVAVTSYPFLPDMVAIASLMKQWREGGDSAKA